MHIFFFIAGIILGLVFSVTMIAGVVWCVQVTMSRGLIRGMAAAAGIAAAQIVLSAIAAMLMFKAARYSWEYNWIFRLGAASILLSMAFRIYHASKIKSMLYKGPLKNITAFWNQSFFIAVTMPMRLPAYISLLIALNLHLRTRPVDAALVFAFGVGLGSLFWWGMFVDLAGLFGKHVKEEISLRSLNKLRTLAIIVCVFLISICLTPMIPGFE